MKRHDEAFNNQIEFLLEEYRHGNVKDIPDLMRLIQMAYGDYIDFHPHELPEPRHTESPSSSVTKED